jgi:mono/diheme cytochrome c family protein
MNNLFAPGCPSGRRRSARPPRSGSSSRLAVLLSLLLTAGCRRDMYIQPSSRPLEQSDFFQDNHMASRPLPAHTIARGQLHEDEFLYTGKTGTNLVTAFPIPITREVLERGKERYEIYCAVCHDRTGEGHGIIVQRGFPAPPAYSIERLRQAPVGHFFDVITHGYGVMYSYADRVSVSDRWAIAAWIRVLQQSRTGTLDDLPAQERAALEANGASPAGKGTQKGINEGKPL